MSIEVIVAAPDKLLTTVAKVKATLGISSTDQDELIEDMVRAASDFVVTYCGRDFARQRVRESIVSKGTPELLLSLTPVINIEFVDYDDSEITDWVLYDKEAGIIQRRNGFQSTNLPFHTIDRAPSSYHEKRWHVTYTGGFVLPNWDVSEGTRNLPYDLERAVIDMVKTQVKTAPIDGNMRSYKIGDTQITWDRSLGETGAGGIIPNSALSVLNYYRRPF